MHCHLSVNQDIKIHMEVTYLYSRVPDKFWKGTNKWKYFCSGLFCNTLEAKWVCNWLQNSNDWERNGKFPNRHQWQRLLYSIVSFKIWSQRKCLTVGDSLDCFYHSFLRGCIFTLRIVSSDIQKILVLMQGRFQLYSFACRYPVLPAPFVEEAVLSPLCSLGVLFENHLAYVQGFIFEFSLLLHWFMNLV